MTAVLMNYLMSIPVIKFVEGPIIAEDAGKGYRARFDKTDNISPEFPRPIESDKREEITFLPEMKSVGNSEDEAVVERRRDDAFFNIPKKIRRYPGPCREDLSGNGPLFAQ